MVISFNITLKNVHNIKATMGTLVSMNKEGKDSFDINIGNKKIVSLSGQDAIFLSISIVLLPRAYF